MPLKVDLPRGEWAEICDPEDIPGEQKRAYQRILDKMVFGDDNKQPVHVPDPANPAVMMEVAPARRRLTQENIQELRDMVHAWCVTSWSYGKPVERESFAAIPAMADEAIEDALDEHGCWDVFNNIGPKAKAETTTTSASTSPDGAPAPPAVPASGPSDGASG